jgi:serine/threonine protein kinase
VSHKLSRGRCKPQVGQHFTVAGRTYELHGKVGDGAVGLVRKARPVDGKSILAVKFLAPDPKYIDPGAFEDVAARFRREAERGSHLDHDHLLRVIAYCENVDGSAFLTENSVERGQASLC